MSAASSWRAMVGLSLREAARQRLWLLFVAAALLVMIVGVRLGAVDAASKLKLAVVGITAAISFVVILLAVLVGAGQVRRDLDARVAFLLFAKPMPRLSYILGRWAGVQGVLLTGITGLTLIGTAVIWATFARVPTIHAVNVPQEWIQLSQLGEPMPIADNAGRIMLNGQPGGALRWTIRGLPADIPADGLDLFVRCQVRSVEYGINQEECLVQISAAPGNASGATAQVLSLAKDSPYGFGPDGASAGEGQVLLRHRDQLRSDYAQDFAHLKLPKTSIGADGSTMIQITRLDSRAQLLLTKTNTIKIAQDGGSLATNLLRGGLVLLASAAMLTAWTLFLGIMSNIGVTLLGGLTLFFAGSAAWTIQDALTYEKLSVPMQRVLELLLILLPDFERFQVAANLAAGQAISWSVVGSAWLYFGAYTVIFLLMAWITLARKEL